MQVKMLINRVGVGEQFRVGAIYDVSDEVGAAWIAAGKAVAVEVAAPKKPRKERARVSRDKETATKKDDE